MCLVYKTNILQSTIYGKMHKLVLSPPQGCPCTAKKTGGCYQAAARQTVEKTYLAWCKTGLFDSLNGAFCNAPFSHYCFNFPKKF